MPPTITCPRETDLLAFASGDKPPPGLLEHLDACPFCRAMVHQLRGEIARLRSSGDPEAPPMTPRPN